MNVLLINPHTYWKSEGNTLKLRSRNFYDNLSIRYLAAALEQAGHSADMIDAHFEEIPLQEIVERIESRPKYDLYGITCTQRILEETLFVANSIKNKYEDAVVAVGGYGATLLGDCILSNNNCIDIAMIGEGEKSIVELAERINDKSRWHEVSGIYFREEGGLFRTRTKHCITDLNELPWPKRADKYPLGKANIIASRGCYGQCTYCSVTEFHRVAHDIRFRMRSPVDVVDEMEMLYRSRGVYYFDFVDDSFVTICCTDKEWADCFVRELEKRNLNFTWGIQSRADNVDLELFRKLRKVGLRAVSIGIENNVTRVIKLFKTGTNYEMHKAAVDVLKQLNISYYIEMIILEPTTTLEEVKENLQFLYDINYCYSSIQTPITFSPRLFLYTGTPIVKDYEGIVDLHYNAYSIDYEFLNPEVAILREGLLYWQNKTNDIAAIHLTYPHYAANRLKKFGLALKAIKLSREYLEFDLSVYRDLVGYLSVNHQAGLKEVQAFLLPYETEVDKYRKLFNEIYDRVHK